MFFFAANSMFPAEKAGLAGLRTQKSKPYADLPCEACLY
jgi:hypothetical protein